MSTIAQLLMALATPLARRVFIALGLSVVTYQGASAAFDGLISLAATSLLGMPADVIGLLNLAGVFQGLSIFTGACVARLALIPLARIIPSVGAAT